jgi:hypothetical protein
MPNARLRRAAAALLVAAPLALLPLASCDRTVRPTEALPPLAPASADAGAGGWRMFVLNAPDQIAVAPPAAVGSDAYRAELASLKAAQAAMTDAQRRNVAHWAGGGVLRWNQTMRELVARYNLPPAPRADGTYPLPDAENPFADPNFPFANPPYAARAYAYVSVAQYEALKAAWHWKYRYNRAAPTAADAGVRAVAPGRRPARLPVGGRGARGRHGGDAQAPLPGVGRPDHARRRGRARGRAARRAGDGERRGRRARVGPVGGRGGDRAGPRRRHGRGRRHARALAGARRLGRRARRAGLGEPGAAGAPADAAELRPRAAVRDDGRPSSPGSTRRRRRRRGRPR